MLFEEKITQMHGRRNAILKSNLAMFADVPG